VTVVAFLIFPTKTNSFNVESLKGHAITKVSNIYEFLPANRRISVGDP
jgi:hypothetical protein